MLYIWIQSKVAPLPYNIIILKGYAAVKALDDFEIFDELFFHQLLLLQPRMIRLLKDGTQFFRSHNDLTVYNK